MNLQTIKFTGAYGTSAQLPVSQKPEISFVGRSNVGKSSLINKIFNRKNLARVSSKPGKTSTINFFSVKECDFVDLPGYGYAKVAKSEKGRWAEMINGYFMQDREFALVVSLIDIRHEPTELDKNMVQFLLERNLPFIIVLTKADKLSKSQQQRQIQVIRKALGATEELQLVPVSAQSGQNIDLLRTTFEEVVADLYH